jgi:hypothetical protein
MAADDDGSSGDESEDAEGDVNSQPSAVFSQTITVGSSQVPGKGRRSSALLTEADERRWERIDFDKLEGDINVRPRDVHNAVSM